MPTKREPTDNTNKKKPILKKIVNEHKEEQKPFMITWITLPVLAREDMTGCIMILLDTHKRVENFLE